MHTASELLRLSLRRTDHDHEGSDNSDESDEDEEDDVVGVLCITNDASQVLYHNRKYCFANIVMQTLHHKYCIANATSQIVNSVSQIPYFKCCIANALSNFFNFL